MSKYKVTSLKVDNRIGKSIKITITGYNIYSFYLTENSVNILRADSIFNLDDEVLNVWRTLLFSYLDVMGESLINDFRFERKEGQFYVNNDRLKLIPFNFNDTKFISNNGGYSLENIKDMSTRLSRFLGSCNDSLNQIEAFKPSSREEV